MAKPTKTKLTAHEKSVLSALFARTNMGMDHPKLGEFKQYRERSPRLNPEPHYADFVMALCQNFMESDAHVDAFEKEAKMWWKEFSKRDMCREYIFDVWPAHHFLMWSEPYFVEGTARYKTEKQADSAQVKRPLSRRYKDGKEWVVTFLSKKPLQSGQAEYEVGYPNAGVPAHKAGAVR